MPARARAAATGAAAVRVEVGHERRPPHGEPHLARAALARRRQRPQGAGVEPPERHHGAERDPPVGLGERPGGPGRGRGRGPAPRRRGRDRRLAAQRRAGAGDHGGRASGQLADAPGARAGPPALGEECPRGGGGHRGGGRGLGAQAGVLAADHQRQPAVVGPPEARDRRERDVVADPGHRPAAVLDEEGEPAGQLCQRRVVADQGVEPVERAAARRAGPPRPARPAGWRGSCGRARARARAAGRPRRGARPRPRPRPRRGPGSGCSPAR